MSSSGFQVLSPGFGYGLIVGIGGFFAVLMLGVTFLQNRYTMYSTWQSEEFNTASRSVKPGLIAAGVVSSWTWSATLLTSSTFAYTYGVSGPMWYGAVGTFQILLFAMIAIKIKANAPGAHTFPEIVLARHGTAAHLTYLFSGFATNLLVGASLVLGGAQIVSAITGTNVYAACFLIPLVVAAYVIVGGLRSTFIADYTHSVILFVAIFVFGITMYATSKSVGNLDRFYDLLVEASAKMPIADNAGGSYLTFRSVNGLMFAIDLAGPSAVFLDQAYWQRAIASRPETSVKAYLLGGLAWYGIPFSIATCLGLGCAALTGDPNFPTYPHPLSAEQNGAGLSSIATAITLLGKGGAGLMLLLLFMAVTSSTSAELIAVSSLITFDVYKTYINPSATSKQLVAMSHAGIIIYSLILAAFCCILYAVAIDLTWILTVLGCIIGGASVPMGLVLLWPKMSKVGALLSPYLAFCLAMIAWFVTTSQRSGTINVKTTGDVTNAVAGNLASWGSGGLIAVILSYLFPKKHSDSRPEHVARNAKVNGVSVSSPRDSCTPSPPEKTFGAAASTGQPSAPDGKAESDPDTTSGAENLAPTGNEIVDFLEAKQVEPMDPTLVKKAERLAASANLVFFLVAVILVPFTLFGTGYVYSRPFFKGWVVVSFIWVWCSMVVCVIYPVVESFASLRDVARGLAKDIGAICGKRMPRTTVEASGQMA